ncbi:hypothetical protein [Serratia marcescens]|uniref:hypothetical protein n=1 Tax=Serratia marcescens TaxID=615 RepID=UPI001660E863|nr:hypothetical protein [Serratia marcescens]
MTLTTERMAEIAKLAIRLQQISGCAAVTSSGETIMHHTFVDKILSALHDVNAELLAIQEAQPVAATPIYQIWDDDGWFDTSEQIWRETYDDFRKEQYRIVYTAPPAPAVPDDYQHLKNVRELYHKQEDRLFSLAQRIKGASFDKYSHVPSQAIDVLEREIFGDDGDAYRAAMLAAAPEGA